MRFVVLAIFYTALAIGANAQTPDIADLRSGDMRKLRIVNPALPTTQEPFLTESGSQMRLANFKGKIIVLNFWATWCAPCRKEMPHLSALQTELGGDSFEVVTIATGRNEPAQMAAFLDEIGVDNLPLHRDPKQKMARKMGVLGLPVTVILNRQGNEIARLQGDADWNGESAKAILRTLIAN